MPSDERNTDFLDEQSRRMDLLRLDRERDKECREIVRRLAEWEESGPWEDLDKIASDAVVLWAKMKGGKE